MSRLKRTIKRLTGRKGGDNDRSDLVLQYRSLAETQESSGASAGDDFQWDLYDMHYRGEMEELAREWTLRLGNNDTEFTAGRLRVVTGKPLHPNWRLLYETILRLEPNSLLELGCGNGMHLANLKTLMPSLEAHGVDRAAGQLQFLRESYPDLADRVLELDATLPFPANTPAVDVAFTQAVLMHIHGDDRHREALANMFGVARRQVVLMENWARHPFLEDIRALREAGRISWPELFCYYRESEDHPLTRLLVCSSEPLPYTELRDYQILMGG